MPPRARKFTGGRNPALRGTGKMSEERAAWCKTALGQMVYMRFNTEEIDGEEHGPNIMLYVPLQKRAPFTLNLTALTAEELEAVADFFNLLFDEARPIVAERDRLAHEAFESGDDSFVRIYRQAPQFIIRSRSKFPDSEGVHDGPEDASSGSGGDGDSADGPGGDGNVLAPGEPGETGPEDDGETTDQSA